MSLIVKPILDNVASLMIKNNTFYSYDLLLYKKVISESCFFEVQLINEGILRSLMPKKTMLFDLPKVPFPGIAS